MLDIKLNVQRCAWDGCRVKDCLGLELIHLLGTVLGVGALSVCHVTVSDQRRNG